MEKRIASHITLDPDLHPRAVAWARTHGHSLARVIDMALAQFLSDPPARATRIGKLIVLIPFQPSAYHKEGGTDDAA